MKHALIDAGGVLIAHGFSDFKPTANQAVLDVSDDFNRSLGVTRWDGAAWVDYVRPVTPRTLSDGELAGVLVRKGLLSASDVTAQ